MDTAWSSFLFQTTPTQTHLEGSLQSELMQVHASSPQSPPNESIATPPSTVDTTALSEDPLPEKPPARPGRAAHICAICNKQFKNSYNLRRHQSVHTGVRLKGGSSQNREGASKEATEPMTLLHLSIVPPTSGLPAPPPQQPLLTHDTSDLAMTSTVTPLPPPTAIVMPTGEPVQQRPVNPTPNANVVRKNHACETCGKAFRDVYHLNRHRLSHSDEKPFSCPVCQQRFKRKDRMSHHVRSHQGGVEKPYVCPHCAKAFSRPDHLNSHVRQVHSTERPFKCPTCESSFATKDRLRAHMIRHEEKVPCHICGKLLSAAYITDHMRVHNQSQHHACHLCNRSFTTLTYLRIHAQKHHGQEWKESGFGSSGSVLVCHLCGVHCKTLTQLQGHMGTHNPPGSSSGEGAPDGTVVLSSSSSSSNMAPAPAVYVSANTMVDLLVTDCSCIAQEPQS
ncbi:myc-associated zinc finger protein isoform X1 [Silurus meridionalis]|uniref:myc-associated zinc finger protein isoform X1 n=1 Tax=Silurus meridionalis TaxID=175797 RepID=UPI001EEA80D9|nr:myc-associated zinc finger protein isoform X1 [Silurus meridionalis]